MFYSKDRKSKRCAIFLYSNYNLTIQSYNVLLDCYVHKNLEEFSIDYT